MDSLGAMRECDAKNNQNNSALVVMDMQPGEGMIQAATIPEWVAIGDFLIKSFVASIQRAERTKASYAASAKHLFKFLDDIGAIHCSCFEVGQFYTHLKSRIDNGEMKAATMTAYIQAAGRVIEWGRVHAQTADDVSGSTNARDYARLFPGQPFADRPKVEHFKGHKRSGLTVDETDKFLNYFEVKTNDIPARKQKIARRNRAMAYLMNELGLRCIEITRLRLADVQPDGRNIRIGIVHKGKTTPCPKYIDKEFQTACYILELKKERQAEGANENDFLFASYSNRNRGNGNQITTRTVENIMVEALKAIGAKCPMITTHSIRHSFATQALEAVPLSERMQAAREIQETMGHSTLDITLTNYAHDIDSKESRIRHIREAQRLERLKFEAIPKAEKKRRGRPKGAKNKVKTSKSENKSRRNGK